MWNFIGNNSGTDYNFKIYRTEIARRGSLLSRAPRCEDEEGSR